MVIVRKNDGRTTASTVGKRGGGGGGGGEGTRGGVTAVCFGSAFAIQTWKNYCPPLASVGASLTTGTSNVVVTRSNNKYC